MHSDWLGTEREKSDVNGWMAESCNSDAWGAQQNCYQSGNTPYIDPDHFTGKPRDPETTLDYFGARYDASSLGRFMTPDPIGIMKQKLFDPQQWNMYSYTRNNPTTLLDPTGMTISGCTGSALACAEQQDETRRSHHADKGLAQRQNQDQKQAKPQSGPAPTNPDGTPKASSRPRMLMGILLSGCPYPGVGQRAACDGYQMARCRAPTVRAGDRKLSGIQRMATGHMTMAAVGALIGIPKPADKL